MHPNRLCKSLFINFIHEFYFVPVSTGFSSFRSLVLYFRVGLTQKTPLWCCFFFPFNSLSSHPPFELFHTRIPCVFPKNFCNGLHKITKNVSWNKLPKHFTVMDRCILWSRTDIWKLEYYANKSISKRPLKWWLLFIMLWDGKDFHRQIYFNNAYSSLLVSILLGSCQ